MEQINRHIKEEIIRVESIKNKIELKKRVKREKIKQLEYFIIG